MLSLHKLTQEIAVHHGAGNSEQFAGRYSKHGVALCRRLERLFRILRSGEPSLAVAPYPGQLFCGRLERRLRDADLAAVIDAVSRDGGGKAGSRERMNYAALDVRHLGSVYETLLQMRFAPNAPLRLCHQSVDRKARGGVLHADADH